MAAAGLAGRFGLWALAIVLTTMVLASPASAEILELSLSAGKLEIKAGDERDRIEVAASRKGVLIKDRGGIQSSRPPCEGGYPQASATVTCPRKKVDEVVIDLGDGNDSFDGDGDLRFEVEGDQGDDEIDGGDARDLIEGKFGDDRIDGSDGSDRLFGGVDDDVMLGKRGRDLLDGGPGKDRGKGGAGKDTCVGIEQAGKGDCA